MIGPSHFGMAPTDTRTGIGPDDDDRDRWRLEFEARLRDRLRAIFEPGRWLTVGEVTQSSVGAASRLVSMTGRDPDEYVLALAGRQGVGPLDDSIRVLSLDVPEGENILEGIRLAHAALADLPVHVQAEVDAWDPDLQARVIRPSTMSGHHIAGRSVFAGRRSEWEALEDKLAILDVWDAAGVAQAPSQVVDLADEDAVAGAHRELAGPLGTVLAVDNDEGWHGGIVGTHWVPTESRVTELRPELASKHRQARIMPFLDGVPCSIHGMVVGDEVISFRPSEMLAYREPSASKLIYGRSATFWEPPREITAAMTAAVEAVGRELQQRVDFRGVFTLDGVAGSSIEGCDGFVPTEVNMRYGAALPTVLPAVDGEAISLYFTNLAEVAGELRGHDHDIEPGDLQRWVRDRLSERGESRIMMFVANGPDLDRSTATVWAVRPLDPERGVTAEIDLTVESAAEDVEATPAADGRTPVATAQWGPAGEGGIIFVELDANTLPNGPIVAPQALCILRSLDNHWNLGLPELEACSSSGLAWTPTSGPTG
jgi:hypothetical protein